MFPFSNSLCNRFAQVLINQNRINVNVIGFRRRHHNQKHFLYTELDSRSLIRVSGKDSFPFLQGLITNDIQNLQVQPSIFTVFLNQAGRILFDSIIYKTATENTVLIECDSHVQQTLIRHLKLYRVRKDVQVDDVAGELKPNVIWDPTHPDIPSSLRSTPSQTCSEGVVEDSQEPGKGNLVLGENLVTDPRVEALGWRVLLPAQESLESKVQKSSEGSYRLLLYSLGIGEGVLDFPIGNSFPLESNVDLLNGVNFHKGCYIGQELTARTHHTGVIRKRLMPFRIPEDAKFSPEVDRSTLQLLNQSGRPVGKVRNIISSYGLALVRVQEALASSEIKLGDHLVQIETPTWWPPEAIKDRVHEK